MNTVDWSVLENGDVMDICNQEALRVSRNFAGVVEYDDLRQEAYIAVATFAPKVRKYLRDDEKGYLARWVWSRLTDIARSEARYSNNTVSLDIVPA